MESLIGYGSDDDNDEVSYSKKQAPSQDANYEEVQMDLSEESNDSTKPESRRDSKHSDAKSKDPERGKRRSTPLSSPRGTPPRRDDRCREKDRDRSRYEKDDKRDDRRDRKDRYREDRKKDDRRDRKGDDKHREKERSYDSREKERSYDSRDNRDDRRSHRGSSRERHRSRSPKRSDYRSKRSSSRERSHSYTKRYDRASSKMDRLEKLGIELNASGSGYGGPSSGNGDRDDHKDRFFMPGITGRFTEQIQRRKLLWQKKEPKVEEQPVLPTQSSKIWQNTTFAQDNDGKVANKFKRLMGIRGSENEANKHGTETLKKQEEMFTSMEAQYEVARTATHTMRGVGLGFGSFQR